MALLLSYLQNVYLFIFCLNILDIVNLNVIPNFIVIIVSSVLGTLHNSTALNYIPTSYILPIPRARTL